MVYGACLGCGWFMFWRYPFVEFGNAYDIRLFTFSSLFSEVKFMNQT